MIDLTINLPDGVEAQYNNLGKNRSFAEVVEAAKIIHPSWTSMVIVISNTPKSNSTRS